MLKIIAVLFALITLPAMASDVGAPGFDPATAAKLEAAQELQEMQKKAEIDFQIRRLHCAELEVAKADADLAELLDNRSRLGHTIAKKAEKCTSATGEAERSLSKFKEAEKAFREILKPTANKADVMLTDPPTK